MELLDIAPPEMGDFDVSDLGYDDLPAHDLVASNALRPQVDFYVALPGLTTTFRCRRVSGLRSRREQRAKKRQVLAPEECIVVQ